MIRVDETDPVGEIEPSFPYRDVMVRRGVEFKDQYEVESEIGRGKFGTVYRCKDKSIGLSLAAKVVNTTKKEDRRSVEREVEIMRRLQHPRLIQLYDAIDTGKQIYVILELIEGGELFERVIDDDFVLTERSCAVFMRQICEGIEFIHAQKILHLDLKPENILCLTKEGNRIKIIDFGLARQYDPTKKLQVLFGTPEFVAPEVVNFDQIGFGTDIWSIGVICYVLLSGLSPFMGDTDIETMANVTIAKYDFDHEAFAEISEDAKDFIRCLLVKDKEKRMSAKQCREHRWLAKKNIRQVEKMIPGPEIRLRNDAEDRSRAVKQIEVTEELDMTKDNLRLFVERWREHPDSPYLLDIPQHLLSCRQRPRDQDETTSLRCHSPSPCGSLGSSQSESNVENSSSKGAGGMSLLNVPTFNLALERRASEGMEKSRGDPVNQIVLAEEIIRLSEHLRSIAMSPGVAGTTNDQESRISDSNSSLSDNSNFDNKTSKSGNVRNGRNGTRNMGKSIFIDNSECNEITQKLSTITRQRKLNGTTFFGTRSFEKQIETTASSFPTLKKTRRNESVDFEGKASRSNEKFEVLTDEINFEKVEMDLTPPWRRPRVKHSFGETSRDVPRISTLRDLHKNLNLDEPSDTKDLLLHLIGEWEDTVAARTSGAGRKSVSVDWCGEDSIARKSMNSLAEYFQSKQRNSGISSSTPQLPSIHR